MMTLPIYILVTLLVVTLVAVVLKYRQMIKLSQQLLRLEIEKTQLIQEVNALTEQIDTANNAQNKLPRLEGYLEQLQLRLEQEVIDKKALQAGNDVLQDKLSLNLAELASLKSQTEAEKEALLQQVSFMDAAKEALSKEFKILSSEVLEGKQKQISENNKENISSLLAPINKSFEEFKQKVETTHKEDIEGRATLVEQLKQIRELNKTMSEETQNLTTALKGDNKLQGNWGEMILESLLESAGLREGIEFDREKSFDAEEGKRLRPDVIINLPGHKHVIIDSKVTLLDYERSLNEVTKEGRQEAVKKHIQNLKKHIKSLATKRYDHIDGLNSADFVLMFVPVEGAYLMAIEHDSGLFEEAFDQRIAVVTPTTLFTTLKMVEQLWRYEKQVENTAELINRAKTVHDKFVGFVEGFQKIGDHLNKATSVFESANRQLTYGQGNLIRQAEMLKDLSGKTKKDIPSHLLNEADGTKLID